jgi:hypothetical protein
MSKHVARPARREARVDASKGILVTAAAVAAVAVVGSAYALAAPPSFAAGADNASFVSAQATPGGALLTPAGLRALLERTLSPIRGAVSTQGSQAAAQVTSMLGDGSAHFSNNENTLTLDVPAIANMNGSVATAIAPIAAHMGALSGPNGTVAKSVNNTLTHISPLLNLNGPHATVSANVPIDLDSAVAPQLEGTTTVGAVTIDPHAGTVTIDRSRLLSADNSGTNALSPAAIAEIGADITGASAALGDNIVSSATKSVEGTPVTVSAALNRLSARRTTGGSSCSSTGTSTKVGSLLGGTPLESTANGVLCSLPTTPLPGLLTSLGLDAGGTVEQLIEGTASPATGAATVLGEPTPFDGAAISRGVASTMANNFSDPAGAGDSASGAGTVGSGNLGSDSTSADAGSFNGTGADSTGADGTSFDGLIPSGSRLNGLNLDATGVDGLPVSGLADQNDAAATPDFLRSLRTTNESDLPGISAEIGSGSTSGSVSSGTMSGPDLLDILGSMGGTNSSVRVGSGAPSTWSWGATGRGSGILGILRAPMSSIGGGASDGSSLLGFGL